MLAFQREWDGIVCIVWISDPLELRPCLYDAALSPFERPPPLHPLPLAFPAPGPGSSSQQEDTTVEPSSSCRGSVSSIITEMQPCVFKEWKLGRQRGTVGLHWTDECETAFRTVIDAVTSRTLSGGDLKIQYHLATDASKTGQGGVLFPLPTTPGQADACRIDTNEYDCVMFLSYQLTSAESNYHTTELEGYAVLKCLDEIRWLVIGSPSPVKVYTDHQALVNILQSDALAGRMSRWQYRLAEYDLDFIHIPGRSDAVADGLSRLPDATLATAADTNEEFPMPARTVEDGPADDEHTERLSQQLQLA